MVHLAVDLRPSETISISEVGLVRPDLKRHTPDQDIVIDGGQVVDKSSGPTHEGVGSLLGLGGGMV